MGSSRDCRKDSAIDVQWPVLYANPDLIGQGIVFKSSEAGFQVAGTMPVDVGMTLKAWVSPARRNEALFIKEAKVLWARGLHFGLELNHMDYQDHEWLQTFLGSHVG